MAEQTPESNASRGPGRPRSAEADRAIVDATLTLVAEHGYAALTMEAVAARAGVGKATLYRRYHSKASLIAAAARDAMSRRAPVPDAGAADEDLRILLRTAVAVLQGTTWGDVLRAVATEAEFDEEFNAERRAFWERRAGELAAIAERGIERGELRSDLDRDLFTDLVLGPIYFRLLVSGAPMDAETTDRIVEEVLDGLRRR